MKIKLKGISNQIGQPNMTNYTEDREDPVKSGIQVMKC
jgi:hypothetical protein